MGKCGIYSITNKKTGQKYIGQSKDITRRFWQHKNQGQSASYIDRAIKKHGAKNFEFEILEECKPSELNVLEAEYIKKYNAFEDANHYNLTSGGDSKYTTSKKTRNKIARKQFERHNGKGTKRDIKYLLNAYYGKDGFTEKKRIGEIWSKDHNTQAKREERLYAMFDLLEGIINELHGNFIITPQEKKRMRYLIRNLSMNNGSLSVEQQLIMIIIYVKLENNTNRQLSDYQTLLHRYDLTSNSFARFQFKVTQHYIERIHGWLVGNISRELFFKIFID